LILPTVFLSGAKDLGEGRRETLSWQIFGAHYPSAQILGLERSGVIHIGAGSPSRTGRHKIALVPQTGLHAGSPQGWLRRLDTLPAWWAWGIGMGVGILAGAVLARVAPTWAGVGGAVLLLAVAAILAASGKPVAVMESVEPVSAGPVASSLVELVSLPAGSFLMGSPKGEEGRDTDEGPVHKVRVSPFACMRAPVTRRVYAEVMGEAPNWPDDITDERPAINVSWFDAIRFCNRLSVREGLPPCYRFKDDSVFRNLVADGYRLLTEAEWEYACRAGSTGRWFFGEDDNLLEEHAWFDRNSGGESHTVGSRKSNPWGLYDMHGNVWEWCWDWYGPYHSKPQTDPVGAADGSDKVLRGGSFSDSSGSVHSASRLRFNPSIRYDFFGFRCARDLA
jgi:formylglycine-generating enzyme required for sulfatase activity